jgi:hypothetical protein
MIKELEDKILQLEKDIYKKCKKSSVEFINVWQKNLTPILTSISKTEAMSSDYKLYVKKIEKISKLFNDNEITKSYFIELVKYKDVKLIPKDIVKKYEENRAEQNKQSIKVLKSYLKTKSSITTEKKRKKANEQFFNSHIEVANFRKCIFSRYKKEYIEIINLIIKYSEMNKIKTECKFFKDLNVKNISYEEFIKITKIFRDIIKDKGLYNRFSFNFV